MTAAVRVLSDNQPAVWHADHSRPESPRIRTLEEEIARVVRARVVNPKWIAGVMSHGSKGAFEMAATVDYLFAFAASARSEDRSVGKEGVRTCTSRVWSYHYNKQIYYSTTNLTFLP